MNSLNIAGSATPPWILRQQALLKQEQEEAKEYYEKYYSQASSASETMQNENNKSNQVLATDKNTDKDEKKSKYPFVIRAAELNF